MTLDFKPRSLLHCKIKQVQSFSIVTLIIDLIFFILWLTTEFLASWGLRIALVIGLLTDTELRILHKVSIG